MLPERCVLKRCSAGLAFLLPAFLSQAAVGADYRFPSYANDLPAGVYWRITGHKAPSEARDLSGVRFDKTTKSWTGWKVGAGKTKKNSDALIYNVALYSMTGGEVVACWRRAPENTRPGRPHPGRAGCKEGSEDEHEDSNAAEVCAEKACSCTIPRSGNFLVVEAPDGRTILYAHLKTDSIPKELCPRAQQFVKDAKDKSGPFGFVPEVYIEPGKRPKIKKDEFIGRVGNAGASSGPHLHTHINKKIGQDVRVEMTFHGARMQQLVEGKGPVANAWKPLNGPLPVTSPRTLIWPDKKLGFVAK
jgi:hypothetical protein